MKQWQDFLLTTSTNIIAPSILLSLIRYMKCTINYHKNDWANLLSLAEFTYNNTIQRSTQQTPFFANYRYYPQFDHFNFNSLKNLTVKDFAPQLLQIRNQMKEKLITTQNNKLL